MTLPISSDSWYRLTPTGCELFVHVVPGSRQTRVAGLHGERLKLQIAALPTDGRANQAIVHYLSQVLDVPRRSVSVVHGHTSRQKVVAVEDGEVIAKLHALM